MARYKFYKLYCIVTQNLPQHSLNTRYSGYDVDLRLLVTGSIPGHDTAGYF